MCGTPSFMAPEVFDQEYSYPSDMWSAGVMMYLLLSGQMPFKANSMMDLSREVMMGRVSMGDETVWKKVSVSAKDLLSRMLQTRPDKRATPQVGSCYIQRRGGHTDWLCLNLAGRCIYMTLC